MKQDKHSQTSKDAETRFDPAQNPDREDRKGAGAETGRSARTGETRLYHPKLKTRSRSPAAPRQPESPPPETSNAPAGGIIAAPPSGPEVKTKKNLGGKPESPKVAPEKEDDSGHKDTGQAATSLPRVKHRSTAMPPSAREYMEVQKKTGREHGKAQKPACILQADRLAGATALVLAVAALVLAWLPRWRKVAGPEDLLDPDLLGIMAVAVLLSLALLLRGRAGRTLAGIMLALQTALLTALLLAGYWPRPMQIRLMEYEALDYFAGANLLAAAVLFSLTAFLLSFRPAGLRIIFAFGLTAAALVTPWLPPEILPLPIAVPPGFPRSVLADNQWQMVERTPVQTIWRHRHRPEDLCTVRLMSAGEGLEASFEQAQTYLQEEWEESGLGLVSTIPWRDRKHQRRHLNFGADRVVDALVVAGESATDMSYLIVFEVAEYAERQSFISEVFQSIE